MKKLIAIVVVMGQFAVSQFAWGLDSIDLGTYRAVDVDTESVIATIYLSAGSEVRLMLEAPDFTMPSPGCTGKYQMSATGILEATMVCPVNDVGEIKVQVDMQNVTKEALLQGNGPVVGIMIDAIGPDPLPFYFRKLN